MASELEVGKIGVNPAAVASGEVTIDSASAYEAKVVFAEGGSNKWAIGNDGDGGDAFVVSAAGNLSTPKLTIDSAGNVTLSSDEPKLLLADATNNCEAQITASNNGELILAADPNDERSSSFISLRVDGTGVGAEAVRIDSAGDVSLTGNLSFNTASGKDITFGDNLGAALDFVEGANVYLRFNTTNGSEQIEVGKLATFSNGIAFQSATEGSGTTGEAFTLNRYETGTFTPTLSFGGASTGITYDYKEGAYTRIGNICHVAIHINLSSKGTSTGAAKIEGLPFPGANKLPSTGIESNLTFPYNSDLSAGEYIAAFVTQLTDKIQLREVSGADRTNANFTDNSAFRLCGSYMCNDA